MKTSVIRYRVADFLREHQPFDVFSMEDLLAFSGTGRVIFHEDDIYLYHKMQVRESCFWVIQQGRVEISDETPMGAQLRDVLGPGDILGLDRYPAFEVPPRDRHTAGGDAFITALIFLRLLCLGRKYGRHTLDTLTQPYLSV